MLDVGCWMLDVGCWMLDVGCWMFPIPMGARPCQQIVGEKLSLTGGYGLRGVCSSACLGMYPMENVFPTGMF
jgi:hypothetical protein